MGDNAGDGFSSDEEVDPNYVEPEPEPDADEAAEETGSEGAASDGSEQDTSGW